MTNRVINTILTLAIYVAGVFILPMLIVKVAKNPDDYWSWVGIVVWIHLMLGNLVDAYLRDPIVKAIKEEK